MTARTLRALEQGDHCSPDLPRKFQIVGNFATESPTLSGQHRCMDRTYTPNLCACGCGEPVKPGKTWVHTHNRRQTKANLTKYAVEDRGYSSPCWVWTGTVNVYGYGQTYLNNKVIGAHRQSYRQHVGPIPDGLVIDHLCRVRACINPAHLEVVTSAENTKRAMPFGLIGRRPIKTHCKQGHPFSGDNLVIHANGVRKCRACIVRWQAEGKARRSA